MCQTSPVRFVSGESGMTWLGRRSAMLSNRSSSTRVAPAEWMAKLIPSAVTVGPERLGRAGQQVLDRRHGASEVGAECRGCQCSCPHCNPRARSFQRRIALIGDHEDEDNIHDDAGHDPREEGHQCVEDAAQGRVDPEIPLRPRRPRRASGSCSSAPAVWHSGFRQACYGRRPLGRPGDPAPAMLALERLGLDHLGAVGTLLSA